MNTMNALNFLYTPKNEEAYDLANIILHLKHPYASSSYKTFTLCCLERLLNAIRCISQMASKFHHVVNDIVPMCSQCRSEYLFESHA